MRSGGTGLEGVWAEALELLPLQERVEIPELQVVLEGDCGRFKDYGACVPLTLLATAENSVSREERLKAAKAAYGKLYLPQRGNRGALLLLLLILADAYPSPLSIADLKSILGEYGVKPETVKKLLYRYYHHYRIMERVGYGLYRLSNEYYKLLSKVMPDWRVRLICMQNLLSTMNGSIAASVCDKILLHVKQAIIYLINKRRIERSRRVAQGRAGSRKITWGVNFDDSDNKLKIKDKSRQCHVNINRIIEVLRERKPALYDQLGSDNDRRIAAELIAVLYKRAREGKPYITGTSGESLHTAISDEAYELLGGSSSIWHTIDWDSIREQVMLLRASGIVFAAKYGVEYKLRIDKKFEKILDEVMGCG